MTSSLSSAILVIGFSVLGYLYGFNSWLIIGIILAFVAWLAAGIPTVTEKKEKAMAAYYTAKAAYYEKKASRIP